MTYHFFIIKKPYFYWLSLFNKSFCDGFYEPWGMQHDYFPSSDKKCSMSLMKLLYSGNKVLKYGKNYHN